MVLRSCSVSFFFIDFRQSGLSSLLLILGENLLGSFFISSLHEATDIKDTCQARLMDIVDFAGDSLRTQGIAIHHSFGAVRGAEDGYQFTSHVDLLSDTLSLHEETPGNNKDDAQRQKYQTAG
jgi:hypothetical protein